MVDAGSPERKQTAASINETAVRGGTINVATRPELERRLAR